MLILDGGLATLLESHNHQFKSRLWSAELLFKNPEAISAAHLEFLKAGADIITTCSYQASFPGFLEAGFGESDAGQLMQRSVMLARKAIMDHQESNPVTNPSIAVSLGCYGAHLANGSEYSGDYNQATEDMIYDYHYRKVMAMAPVLNNTMIAFETIPNQMELNAILRLVRTEGILNDIPFWISFCCRDGHSLSSGETLTTCADTILQANLANLFAVGVNCVSPSRVPPLLSCFPDLNLISYPNNGDEWNSQTKSWSNSGLDPTSFSNTCLQWSSQFPLLQIIGGCCRVTPEHIQAMSTQFKAVV